MIFCAQYNKTGDPAYLCRDNHGVRILTPEQCGASTSGAVVVVSDDSAGLQRFVDHVLSVYLHWSLSVVELPPGIVPPVEEKTSVEETVPEVVDRSAKKKKKR